jgi:hypothetical protein
MKGKEDELRKMLMELRYDVGKVTLGFETSGHVLLAALNALGRDVSDHFLRASAPKLPREIVDPTIQMCPARQQSSIHALFDSWSKESSDGTGRRIAIIAAPGAGKTVLLSRFARQLRGYNTKAEPGLELAPVTLFLTPTDIPGSFSEGTLWDQIQGHVSAARAGYHAAEAPGMLEPFRKRGLIYLLFDGLDEFGARRRGDMKTLMMAFRHLAEENRVNIFLTCRKVFWDQQVEQKHGWVQTAILPFTDEEINRLVPHPGLGQFAYDDDKKPRPGVLNPLIVSFVVGLRDSTRELPKFTTRSELYECWAESAAAKAEAATGIAEALWLEDFREIGFQLLKDEAMSAAPPTRMDVPPIQFHQYLTTEIVVPSGDGRGLKFFHESVNEFFVAWTLADSFLNVVDAAQAPQKLRSIRLAKVDLDFLQTSVYGFLHDRLGPAYLGSLLDALTQAKLTRWDRQVLRNLVEYVGMTYRGGTSCGNVARWLVTVIQDNELDFVVRYNAARALERVHPWAPRPYFDYMSDWGEKDWSEERIRSKTAQIRPWAIRGHRSTDPNRRRQLGDFPPIAICTGLEIDGDLQREISGKLLDILQKLLSEWRALLSSLSERHEDGRTGEQRRRVDWLLVNCTHALVRWYHDDHQKPLEDLKEEAGTLNLGKHAMENLRKWVLNPLCRNA